jgi:TRAP-type C4-dicarboxylate transport system permease small subunit
MATLAVACALPYTHQARAHIGVDILVRLLSERARVIIAVATHLVALALFGIVTWQMFLYADTIHASGTVSMSLQFPEHLIIHAVAVCFLVFSLVIAGDIVSNLTRPGEDP